jgi:methylmalonyl-CoA mutase C-terminal domain/subunit
MGSKSSTRVLLSKVGLDSHIIGLRYIAFLLKEAGIEVIYLGPYQSPKKIVSAAIQEDVDVIGLSFLGGEHLVNTAKVLESIKEAGVSIPIILGGIIPDEDVSFLKEIGVTEVFSRTAPSSSIVPLFNDVVGRKSSKGK